MAELCAELAPLLEGRTVRDVQGLPPRDLLVVLEHEEAADDGPAVLRLRLSASPDAPRIHLQQGRVHKHEGPVGPFFQRVARELPGAVLRSIAPVRRDRIALVEFTDGPEGEKRALLLELFGRRANLVLLGPRDRVVDVLVPPPRKGARAPRLVVGEPWVAPGRGGGAGEPGPSVAEAFPAPDGDPPGRDPERAPLSWRVESALGARAREAFSEEARRKLRQRVKRKLGRARGLVRGLERKAAAAGEADRARRDGELLAAAQHRLARGMESIELEDWSEEGAPPRRIELDPKLAPHENVERLFARYRKLERAAATVDGERRRAERRVADLEALAARAEDPDEDPVALDAEAVEAGLLDPQQVADVRKRRAPEPRKPYRTFVGSRGGTILVGRGASDNDELTVRVARGNDAWLHTADHPGSHVVLRVPKGGEPDPEEVLDAAHLAVHFSPARGTDRASVHVARKKHVHKPRGAKPGLVQLSGGRVMRVRMEPARLERLLRRGDGNRPPADE